MTIKLPVVGLTEDSQRVLDEHYQKHVLEQEERVKSLQTQGEVIEEPEEVTAAAEVSQPEVDPERSAQFKQVMDKLTGMTGESQSGVGEAKLMNKRVLMGDGEMLDDTYGFEKETAKINFADNDDEDDKAGDG